MAVPGALPSWHQFVERKYIEVERKYIEPDTIAMAGPKALPDDERVEYDQNRFARLGADIVLTTHETETLQRQARSFSPETLLSLPPPEGARLSRVNLHPGKSTIAIGKRHETAMRWKYERTDRALLP